MFIALVNIMYKYVHNNKYQMKYREFAKDSKARKEVKDNIYTKRSKAGNFFFKNNLKLYTGAPKSRESRVNF